MTDDATRTIAFVLYPGLTPLDMIVPLQVLASLATADPRYAVTVVAERVEPVISDLPVRLTPEKAFDQVPDPYIVVVPGGTLGTVRAMVDPVLRAYLVAAAPTAHKVASVCSGALILAAAGLLDGRNATTHWAFAEPTGWAPITSGNGGWKTASSCARPASRQASTWHCTWRPS